MVADFDIVIIGAGVVGLSIGYSLAKKTNKILIIEKDHTFGLGTSSRNSEVIHSGIYYPKNYLKSKLCISGAKLLYKYCDSNNIRYNKCGKLIIATSPDEQKFIKNLKKVAIEKGIHSKIIYGKDITKLESNVKGNLALHIKNSGIIDSHGLMVSLENKLQKKNVLFAYKTKVKNIDKINSKYKISILNPDNTNDSLISNVVINSSGLSSHDISKSLGIKNKNYNLQYCKGEYFWIRGVNHNYIKRLIYPIPEKNMSGLGIHSTLDLEGRVKLGPNAIYIEKNNYNYSVNEKHGIEFFNAASKYLPNLKINQLEPDFSGIRPKLNNQFEQRPRDFIINNETDYGFSNFINLVGIESPGLTASLAIGNYVASLINWDF